MNDLKVLQGDCIESLKQLADESVQCCVTSPPYFGLRDYGHDGQIGLEATPDEYVAKLVQVFREVRRVLRKDGTLWLNLGDSYAAERGGTHQPAETLAGGSGGRMADGDIVNRGRFSGINPTRNARGIGLKHKDLIGIPWRVAFALQADGWYLRQDIIWHKPNPMPESVQDRCTKAHEYVFLLTKSDRYFYDNEAVSEPVAQSSIKRLTQPNLQNQLGSNRVPGKTNGTMNAVGNCESRNRRSVWTINTQGFKGAHFATFPIELPRLCIAAGSKAGDVILDPFGGSGTTGQVALESGRSAVLCELNPEYVDIINQRCTTTIGLPL
jgi:DNA modification methylase